MSFAISDDNTELSEKCSDARRHGIVMLCSTHDEGPRVSKAFPADYADTIAIAACDAYGRISRDKDANHNMDAKYNYKIHGVEIATGKVPFLVSEDRISGSSVATAIAAGLSSLILSCDRLAFPGRKYFDQSGKKAKFSRQEIVEHYFERMVAKQDTKFLILENLGGIDAKVRDGLEIDAEEILTNWFFTAQRT